MRLTSKLATIAVSLFSLAPLPSQAGIAVSITVAPPVLPVYVQPPCPREGYLWTPGYWAWGGDDYYWVPGVWVAPPRAGFLWTPGYWGFGDGIYVWRAGYWGPHVGFYGGVNYGFGYSGVGFVGGVWAGPVFRYNTAVVNVNTTVVRNVYVDRTVLNNTTVVNRTSFNGAGGIAARPTAVEQTYAREQHLQPTANQISHEQTASRDRSQFASVNHGRPATASMDSVNGRAYNQQARIANGVASGRLTPGETSRLEGREANVNREVRNERQANGGTLTPQERQQVNRQQNNMSKSIEKEKHNPQANQRAEQQKARREEK
jgi:WXXGXW repeat (2 copies)